MAQLTQIKDLQRKRKARQKRKNFLASNKNIRIR